MSDSKWLKGSVLLALSGIISRFLGLGRDALLSRVGGLSYEVDAYNLAFTLPDLLNHFLGAGLLSVTLIPLLAPSLKEKKYEEASHLLSSIFGVVFGTLLILTVGCWIWVENLVPLLMEDTMSPEVFSLTVRYTRIVLFGQIFFLAGGFFNAWQYGQYHYTFPALAPLIYNASIIIGGLVGLGTGSVEGFCWGVLVGAALGAGLLQYYGAKRLNLKLSLRKPGIEFRRYLWLTLPFALGVSMTFSNELLFKYFGGSQEGAVASLGFGLRITMAFVGVFGGAVGVAAYPYLSELCSKLEYEKVNETLVNTLLKIGCVLLPALPVVALFAEPLVEGYLGSNASMVERVSENVRAYLLLALPMSMQLIVSRIWYADQRTWKPAVLTFVTFALSIPLYSYSIDWGVVRIPIISAFVSAIQLLSLLFFWKRLHPEGSLKPLIGPLSYAIILHVLLIAFKPWNFLNQYVWPSQGLIAKLLIAFIAGGLIYVFGVLGYLLVGGKVPKEFMRQLLKKVRLISK